ncbi:MAG: hypothetical protein AAGK22_18735 [Acidobacteriota bacterium]
MERQRSSARRHWVVASLPVLIAQTALLILWDPTRSGGLFLVIMAFGFSGMVWAVKRLGVGGGEREPSRGLTLPRMLAVALLLRVVALPLPATLSDDIYRYIWDGTVVLAGFNPYSHAPDAEVLVPLRDEVWEKTAHRGVETVYPPVAEGLFSIAAATPIPQLLLKTLIALLDLLGCVALWSLAVRRGVDVARTLAYAWNPLVVLEGAGMGHVDAAGVAATVIAVWALLRMRDSGRTGDLLKSAVAGSVGVLIKLVPVVAVPLWIAIGGGRFALAIGLLLAVGVVPVLVATGGVPPGLVTYGVSWEFNGPLFEPLYRLLDLLDVDVRLKAVVEWLKHTLEVYEPLDRLYPYIYPQFLAKACLAIGVIGLVVASLRERDDWVGSGGRLLRRVLLFSATLYPWYLTWAMPWAALAWRRSWLLLAATIQLAYLPRLFGIEYFPWVYLWIWIPFALVAGWERWKKPSAPGAAPRVATTR